VEIDHKKIAYHPSFPEPLPEKGLPEQVLSIKFYTDLRKEEQL